MSNASQANRTQPPICYCCCSVYNQTTDGEKKERRNARKKKWEGKKTLISFTVQKNARSKANSQGSYESECLRGGETIKRIQLKKK